MTDPRRPTLSLTHNRLLEPLRQSQAAAYLRGLSRDYCITVIPYEQDADRAAAVLVARQRADCVALGIDWQPQHFLPRARLIQTFCSPAAVALLRTAAATRLKRCFPDRAARRIMPCSLPALYPVHRGTAPCAV